MGLIVLSRDLDTTVFTPKLLLSEIHPISSEDLIKY